MHVLAIARGRHYTNDVPNSSASRGRTSSPVEPKVADESVGLIESNHPHVGSGSLSLLLCAADVGVAACYMKKLLFDVAVSAVSDRRFLSNVFAEHALVSPQASPLCVALSQSNVCVDNAPVCPPASPLCVAMSQSNVCVDHAPVSPPASPLYVALSQSNVCVDPAPVSPRASPLSVPLFQSYSSGEHAVVRCIVFFAYNVFARA